MRALLVAVLLVATGCGAPAGDPTPVGAPDLTATDLAFVDLVIPQNESALAAIARAR